MQNRLTNASQPDTFICHASEDKEALARPLHKALTELRLHAWLDESDIPWGESIRQRIDQGISVCRSATVILSRIFFDKYWTQYELDGIFQRRMGEGMPLFPIQHGITIEEIRGHSPSLAGINLLNSNEHTIERIAAAIADRLGEPRSLTQQPSDQPPVSAAEGARTFGVIYVAPAGTPELQEGQELELHTFAFLGEPTGWMRMVEHNEELEYVIDQDKLRVQIDRGGQWSGTEYQADQLMFSGEPFSVIIRRDERRQIYLPSLVSTSSRGFLLTSGSASGWRSFQVQG